MFSLFYLLQLSQKAIFSIRYLQLLSYRRVHRHAPLRSILGTLAANHLKVQLLQRATDRTNLHNGSNLCPGAAQENLISPIELRAIYLPLARNAAKLAPRQLHHSFTGNAQQYILCRRWCHQFTIHHQENVLGASLRDVTLVREHNRLVEAVLERLAFSKCRIDIRPTNLTPGWNSVIINAPPGRNTAVKPGDIDIISKGLHSNNQVIGKAM